MNPKSNYALIIGVGSYKNLPPLSKPSVNACDIEYTFLTSCGFIKPQIKLLKDDQATRENILNHFAWLSKRANPDSTIVIFFSGHGIKKNEGDVRSEYLCPVDCKIENLRGTAISSEEITMSLNNINAGRIIIFLEACHAGDVIQSIGSNFKSGLSEQAFNQLSDGKERIIIASCKPDEFSWELKEGRNSLFTSHLIKRLQDKGFPNTKSMIYDLFNHLRESVSRHANLKKLDQNPVLYPTPSNLLRRDKNFQRIVDLTKEKRTMLFIGEDVSVEAGMPALNFKLFSTLKAKYQNSNIPILADATFSKNADIVQEEIGRKSLIEFLDMVYKASIKSEPPPFQKGAYQYIHAITPLNRIIFTTNWDDLLMCSFEKIGLIATEIIKNDELALIPSSLHAIIKLHGSLKINPIITKTDYSHICSNISTNTAGTLWGYAADMIAQYSFIFVGFDLKNSIFQLIHSRVKNAAANTQDASHPHFYICSSQDKCNSATDMGFKPVIATAKDFFQALFSEFKKFVNRVDELKFIFSCRSKTFIEYVGHFGIGKTALLDEVQSKGFSEEWHVLRVNWDKKRYGKRRKRIDSMEEIIQVVNEELGRNFQNCDDFRLYLEQQSQTLLLIFDAIDNVDKESMKRFISEACFPAINQPSKFLISGRFSIEEIVPPKVKSSFASKSLIPFTLDSVREMAEKYLLATVPNSQEKFSDVLIEDIWEVSGGNAYFINSILTDITAKKEIPPYMVEEQKRKYVEQFNKIINDSINWNGLQTDYEAILCIFRWLNRELIQKTNISKSTDVLLHLRNIFIISPIDFTSDLVIRRIKTLHLYYSKPDDYIKAHQLAQSIFKSGIETLIYPIQLDYIIEWLFHTANILLAEFTEETEKEQQYDKRYDELIKFINEIHYRCNKDQVRGTIGNVINRIINNDLELQSLLARCIGEHTNEVIKILEQKEDFDVSQP